MTVSPVQDAGSARSPARDLKGRARSTFPRSTFPRSHVLRSHVQRSHVPTFNVPRSTFPVSTFPPPRPLRSGWGRAWCNDRSASTGHWQRPVTGERPQGSGTFNVPTFNVPTFPRSTFNVLRSLFPRSPSRPLRSGWGRARCKDHSAGTGRWQRPVTGERPQGSGTFPVRTFPQDP